MHANGAKKTWKRSKNVLFPIHPLKAANSTLKLHAFDMSLHKRQVYNPVLLNNSIQKTEMFCKVSK